MKKMLAGAGLALLGGCTTTFDAVRVTKGLGDKNVPVAGAPYNMTFTRFDITVTQQIACEADKEPTIGIKAEATPSEVRDPQRAYVIDMASLQSFFKTADVQVAYYDNGALKSINASAEDMTGEFVASAVQTIATVAIGTKGVQLMGGLQGPKNRCSAATVQLLKDLQARQDELETLNDELTTATEQLKQYTAFIVALSSRVSPAERTEFDGRLRKIRGIWARQQKAKDEVKLILPKVAVVTKVKWPADGETFHTPEALVKPVDAGKYGDWLASGTSGEFGKSLFDNSAVYFQLAATEPLGRESACGENCAEPKGLKYRMPAQGKLYLCNAQDVLKDTAGKITGCARKEEDLAYGGGPVSQLGRIHVLPLHSAMFSKKSIAATFSEQGVPTLLGVSSSAGADKASAMLASVGDSVVSLYKARSEVQVNELEAKIKLLTLQKQYQDAVKAASPLATADGKTEGDFTASAALAKAELADIEARRALDEAKKAGN